MEEKALPLAGIQVVEFSHMVMGPTAGLVLADLGADVIKIEPPDGDRTRRLRGSGAGYFPMYSRNKRSIAIDLHSETGCAIAKDIIVSSDVLIENFRPGAMEKLGFGEAACTALNSGLIYCSAKGFLAGPYEQRTALDEIAQMMGGLAYMTGPPGRPLRAGASVVDVLGGVFAAVGILAALHARATTGKGRVIRSGLYENCVFLVGQHMAQYVVTGQAAPPMPTRISAWGVYDLFTMRGGEKIFVGIVSDPQWQTFCAAFHLEDLAGDKTLSENNARVQARDRILPRIQQALDEYEKGELIGLLEQIGLPFALVRRPEDLFDDTHLKEHGLLEMKLPEKGGPAALPALPLEIDGARPGLRHSPPEIGADTWAILAEYGYDEAHIHRLIGEGVVIAAPGARS